MPTSTARAPITGCRSGRVEIEDIARAPDRAPSARWPAEARAPAHRRPGRRPKWIAAVAKDLQAHRGTQPRGRRRRPAAGVHALAHAMNQALGNAGRTVVYTDPVEAEPVDQLESLRDLVADMNAGKVDAARHRRRQPGLHGAGRPAVRGRRSTRCRSASTSASTTMRRRRCATGTFPKRTSSRRGATRAATTARCRSSSRSSRRSTAASRRTSCSPR